ncbi:MAG: AAA family ATPase [Syntrophomonas sp.]|nr:AAA family ATPase [Syntrophomonas sp.]
MKAGLIVKLIEAHSSGNESIFEKALLDLSSDEERKGNSSIALSLKKAYSSDKKPLASLSDSPISNMSYSAQGIASIPKDKDSTLELVDVMQSTVKLSDVALNEKTFEVLNQIIDEQKKAADLLRKGITPTNRVLFCGPPGCGKTLAANALAGELGIPVAYVKLDGLISSYLGQTGTNIRKIFEFVKNKRIMLFLDEFDAIAKKRDDSHELGELKRVVTTLLQNLDAMPASVFLVAATNHHHLLDPAIWRRFDVSILMELPNQQQRVMIISKFLKECLEGYSIDANVITVLTDGMSGAQICSFMQSLAKHCVMNEVDPDNVLMEDIANVWLKHTTLFVSENSEGYIKALSELSKNGVPMRTLEKITGIPKSTLSYRFNKEVKPDGRE